MIASPEFSLVMLLSLDIESTLVILSSLIEFVLEGWKSSAWRYEFVVDIIDCLLDGFLDAFELVRPVSMSSVSEMCCNCSSFSIAGVANGVGCSGTRDRRFKPWV